MLQISHALQIIVGWGAVGAHCPEDFLTELVDDLRVLAQLVEEEGESASGGVTARKEDGNDLVADDLAVARGVRKSVEERLILGIFETGRVEREALGDNWLDEIIHDTQPFPEGFAIEEAVEGAGTGNLILGDNEVSLGFFRNGWL